MPQASKTDLCLKLSTNILKYLLMIKPIGIANVLAFFNKNEDALEIYKLLAQANPQMAEPLINQAHLSVGDKKYDLAINLYEIVL